MGEKVVDKDGNNVKVERIPKHLYYFDKEGYACHAPMSHGGAKLTPEKAKEKLDKYEKHNVEIDAEKKVLVDAKKGLYVAKEKAKKNDKFDDAKKLTAEYKEAKAKLDAFRRNKKNKKKSTAHLKERAKGQ